MANEELYGGIGQAYKNYLGRDARQDELEFHARTSPDNYDDVIKNSSEAQEWSKRGQTSSAAPAGSQPAAQPAPVADQWGNAPGSSQAGIDAFWDQVTNKKRPNDFTPQELSSWGVTQVSPDKYRLNATGQIVDTARDFGAGGANEFGHWTISGGAPGQNGQGGVGGGNGSAGGGVAGLTPGGAGGYDPATGDLRNQFVQQLLQRSHQGLGVSEDDPNIRAQSDPYAAAVERQRRDYLADLAEKSGPLANLRGEQRLSSERAGQAVGGMKAELIGREITARRDEIQNALSQIGSRLSVEDQTALSRELAQLNASLQSRGLDLQGQQMDQQQGQFMQELGLRSEDRASYWDALRSGLIQG